MEETSADQAKQPASEVARHGVGHPIYDGQVSRIGRTAHGRDGPAPQRDGSADPVAGSVSLPVNGCTSRGTCWCSTSRATRRSSWCPTFLWRKAWKPARPADLQGLVRRQAAGRDSRGHVAEDEEEGHGHQAGVVSSIARGRVFPLRSHAGLPRTRRCKAIGW